MAKRTRTPSVRFTDQEWEIVKRKADSANIPPTTFIRRAALRRDIPHRTTPEAIKAVNRIGVNLNQIARVTNTTGRTPTRLHETLDAVLTTLARLVE